jgi:hypothetical protein
LKKSQIYASTLMVLMLCSFGLIHQASSQPANQDNLKVLDYSYYFDNIGGFHAVGEIQNIGTTILNPVVIGGTIYTPDGTDQLRSTPCIVFVNYMLPQQKACFLMDFPMTDMSWTSQGLDHIGFTVIEANSNSSYQYQNLTITDSKLSTDADGTLWATGTVKNTGGQTATNVRVIATFYNASNAVVAVGYSASPSNINPSGSASFKAGAYDINQTLVTSDRKITSYTLYVQTEGPLLSGTPPTPTSTSGTSSTPSTSDNTSSPDSNSSSPATPGLNYGAIIVVVIVVVGVALLFFRRKQSQTSVEKRPKSQTSGKRRPPPRNRRRDV